MKKTTETRQNRPVFTSNPTETKSIFAGNPRKSAYFSGKSAYFSGDSEQKCRRKTSAPSAQRCLVDLSQSCWLSVSLLLESTLRIGLFRAYFSGQIRLLFRQNPLTFPAKSAYFSGKIRLFFRQIRVRTASIPRTVS